MTLASALPAHRYLGTLSGGRGGESMLMTAYLVLALCRGNSNPFLVKRTHGKESRKSLVEIERTKEDGVVVSLLALF